MATDKDGKGSRKATSGSGKWTQYNRPGTIDGPTWEEVDASLVSALIGAVTQDGDAVIFGVTRDGGALALTICSGEERGKYYASSSNEMDQTITTMLRLAKE